MGSVAMRLPLFLTVCEAQFYAEFLCKALVWVLFRVLLLIGIHLFFLSMDSSAVTSSSSYVPASMCFFGDVCNKVVLGNCNAPSKSGIEEMRVFN